MALTPWVVGEDGVGVRPTPSPASELRLGSGHFQPGNQITELRNKGDKRGILFFCVCASLQGRVWEHVVLVLWEEGRGSRRRIWG